MVIVAVSLFISSYSYGSEICLGGVTPSGKKCDQNTQTTTIPVKPDVSGGSSGGNTCVVLKGTWENHKINIAKIRREAKGKLKNLKKSFKYDKRAFKAKYKRTRLPQARKQHKTKAWIRSDYRRQWNRYKNLKKKKYYSARKAIIEHAKSEIMWRKEDMRKIKEEYGRKCKSKK